jgi:uncharacterized protein (TIGR04255 family)
MHYRRNFLSKVVCRLDFGEVPALKGQAKPEFSTRIEQTFPIATGKPTAVVSLMVGPKGSGIQQELSGMIWEHKKKSDGTQVLNLAPTFLSLEYGTNDYDHFPPFRAELQLAFTELQALYQVAQVTRIGLRYINEIALQQGQALDWHGLLNPNLITSVKAGLPENLDLLRSLHQIHAQRDGMSLMFHYGAFNPDYPNPLVRRHFVLDIDASRSEPTLVGEVMQHIDRLNQYCETQFEASIENGLREKLEIIND